MSVPGIELRRHECIQYEQWQALRPKLKYAAALAVNTAVNYGMELHDTKYAYYHAVGPRYPGFGEARTAKTMHWFLGPGKTKGLVDIGLFGCKILHELVHQFREELVPTNTIGSLAATEGVAYNIESISRKEGFFTTWRSPHPTILQLVSRIDDKEMGALYDELGEDMNKTFDDEAAVNKWCRVKRKLGIRMVDVVGIAAVQAQLRQGYEASEIWRLPTLEVLGYEAVN